MTGRLPGMVALAVLLVGVRGCGSDAEGCESICRRFVDECGFSAWQTVEQCAAGCVEDLYRRDDKDRVLECYHAAVDAPTREQAEVAVDAAIEAGLFSQPHIGPFDREAAVQEAVAAGTCDVFAVVQCKVDSIQVPVSGTLIGP